MNNKILHIAPIEKFIPNFIKIIQDNFNIDQHTIFTLGNFDNYPYKQTKNTIHFRTLKSLKALCILIWSLHSRNKIILHGLFMHKLTILLCFMPWLHKKCQWVIWGGDLYYHQLAVKGLHYKVMELFRKILIKRLGGLITYVDGDYHKAQKWYGAKGKLYESFMYKSNIYSGPELSVTESYENTTNKSSKITLLVGNSADPTNNHQQVFQQLINFDLTNLVDKIYCPLSYGDVDYAKKIKQLGDSMFGNKFVPLIDFMPLQEYNLILDEVDIAFFAHNRQQAMGNTINLLGRGKTVYMRTDISSYGLLNKLGVMVNSLDKIELKIQPTAVSISNNKNICAYFNEKNLVKQLTEIFS